MKNLTITKEELINIGYKPTTAQKIIKQAKQIMVDEGFDFYDNKNLTVVPSKAVEKILGIELPEQDIQEG